MSDFANLCDQLTYSLQSCLIIVCVVVLLFPALRFVLPGIYNTIICAEANKRIQTLLCDQNDAFEENTDVLQQIKKIRHKTRSQFKVDPEHAKYVRGNRFVQMFMRFQNVLMAIFAILSGYQLVISFPLHYLSQDHESELFFYRQLIHNVPQSSYIEMIIIFDVIVCIFTIEVILNKYYKNYYIQKKMFSTSCNQQNNTNQMFLRYQEQLERQTRRILLTMKKFDDSLIDRVLTEIKEEYTVSNLIKIPTQILKIYQKEKQNGKYWALIAKNKDLCERIQHSSIASWYKRYILQQKQHVLENYQFYVTYNEKCLAQYHSQNGWIVSYIIEFENAQQAASAYYKYNLDIYNMKTSIVPLDDEIIMQNINKPGWKIIVHRVIYIFLVIALVLFYFFPQQTLLTQVSSQQSVWYKLLSNMTCKDSTFCKWVFKIIFTITPITINGILIGVIPFLVWYASILWSCTCQSERRLISFVTLVIFYSIFWGMISLIFPSSIFDSIHDMYSNLITISFPQLTSYISNNLAVQSLVFMQFVVVKYVLFPVFSLVRIPHIIYTLLYKIRSAWSKNKQFISYAYDYHMKMAYMMHLFVSGIIYMPISPFNTIIVMFCLITMSLCNDYNIFYIADTRDQLSISKDCFGAVIDIARISVIMMLLICISYYQFIDFPLSVACVVILGMVLVCYFCYLLYQKHQLRNILKQNLYLYGRQYQQDSLSKQPLI